MRLYSYIVSYDGGFAPCVANGLCTLACCKPRIRKTARYGDWVAGTTPKKRGSGRLVYLMRVERAFSFAEYYRDREMRRRPDNIYRPTPDGNYVQKRNSAHGPENFYKDLSADRILASREFVYFGENAPTIPSTFREFVAHRQGHRVLGSAPR